MRLPRPPRLRDEPKTLTAPIPPESCDIDTILDQVRADPAGPLAPRPLEVTAAPVVRGSLASQTPAGRAAPSVRLERMFVVTVEALVGTLSLMQAGDDRIASERASSDRCSR